MVVVVILSITFVGSFSQQGGRRKALHLHGFRICGWLVLRARQNREPDFRLIHVERGKWIGRPKQCLRGTLARSYCHVDCPRGRSWSTHKPVGLCRPRRMPTGPLIVSYFLDHQWNSCNHKLRFGLTAAENGAMFMKLWLRADHASSNAMREFRSQKYHVAA